LLSNIGAVKAAGEIGSGVAKQVRNAVTGTIDGVKVVLQNKRKINKKITKRAKRKKKKQTRNCRHEVEPYSEQRVSFAEELVSHGY
jgi:hypothetical protein